MPEAGVLQFLAKKPERDAAADADFDARFDKNIGPAFRAVDADIEKGGHSEYLLKPDSFFIVGGSGMKQARRASYGFDPVR